MEQKYIGAVESAAYGFVRVLGSVTRSMCDTLQRLFSFTGREGIETAKSFSPRTEVRNAQAPSSSGRAEFIAPSEIFEAPLQPKIRVSVAKEYTVAHAAISERTKDAEFSGSLEGIGFTSKLERLKAEAYAADFRSPDKEVRSKSLEQIKKLPQTSAIGVLKKLLLSAKELLQTVELISALGEINDKGILDKRVFVDFLKSQNPSVRQAAVRALAKYQDDESFLYISGILLDPEAEVRRQALNCLAWFFGERCAQPVAKCMHDIDASVRKSAALMSGSMKLSPSISGLITLLSDSDHGVQKAASDSLIKITGQDCGFRVNGSAKSRSEAIEGWRFWWRNNQSKFMAKK